MSLDSLDVIAQVIAKHNLNKKARIAQEYLANTVVQQIHGKDALLSAQRLTAYLFETTEQQITTADLQMLKTELPNIEFNQDLAQMLITGKVVQSKRELRELLATKALKINGTVLASLEQEINFSIFDNQYLIIKKGKRHHFLVCL